jgi:ABC-2 type transport system permease protein
MVSGIMPDLHLNIVSVLVSLAFLLVTTVGLVSIGLILGSQMESPEGFQLIGSFLIFPLFFLSGALFPITNLPPWLAPFIFVNPITYSVDGVRGVMMGFSKFNIAFDFAIVCLFAAIMIVIGTYAFKKMKI